MSTVSAIDWNAWRANYDRMSFAEHQAFNAEVARQYPEQKCWNVAACADFIYQRQPRIVCELGGWDGSLAAEILADDYAPVEAWWNYDITPGVPQVCHSLRYDRVVLSDWPWNMRKRGDTLIASHVFEHMRMSEIEKLVQAWDVDSIYIDCPIGTGAQSWHNYEGTHILEVGSTELLWRLEQIGYQASFVDTDGGGLIAYLDRA